MTGWGSSNVTSLSCAATPVATPQSRAHQSALRMYVSELWVANGSRQPSTIGGGGTGDRAGEGGSVKGRGLAVRVIGATTATCGVGGAGTAVETARSRPPVI